MSMTREELLNELKLKSEVVEIGKGKVIVSEIGASDYISLWSDPKNQKATGEMVLKDGKSEPVMVVDMARFTPALIVYAVTDAAGNRIFTDEDIDLIARGSQGPFLKIADVARRLNGMVGDEVKNSEGSQSVLPSSDSASTLA